MGVMVVDKEGGEEVKERENEIEGGASTEEVIIVLVGTISVREEEEETVGVIVTAVDGGTDAASWKVRTTSHIVL